MKKLLLTLAVLAVSAAAPVFAGNDQVTTQGVECYDPPGGPNGGTVPDGGATALLAAVSFGGLAIAKKAMKKR